MGFKGENSLGEFARAKPLLNGIRLMERRLLRAMFVIEKVPIVS